MSSRKVGPMADSARAWPRSERSAKCARARASPPPAAQEVQYFQACVELRHSLGDGSQETFSHDALLALVRAGFDLLPSNTASYNRAQRSFPKSMSSFIVAAAALAVATIFEIGSRFWYRNEHGSKIRRRLSQRSTPPRGGRHAAGGDRVDIRQQRLPV